MKTTGTTYTITELKELRGGAAYENALTWIAQQTGLPRDDEETLMIEADEFKQLFTWTGKPVRN